MRKLFACATSLLAAGMLFAAVPNRITYQGRLSKNSSPVIGSHTFGVRIYPAATPAASLWQDLNIPVTLGPEGEFTIVLEIGDIDWINTDPRLEITVDGEKLSPADSFETTPYSFVAKRVDAGGVNTAALADGAVTNAKVAVGIESSKILVSTSPGNTYLSDWRHPVSKDKIDASKIEGTIPTIPSAHGASHAAGGSDALSGLSRTQVAGTALVANSTFTQVLQAVSVSTAVLAVKGLAGSGSKILQVYDSGILGNTGSVPQEQAWFDKDANLVTNKGITAGSGGFTGLTATTGTVSTLTVATMTATGTSTFNRITASSVTVAGPLNVTGRIRDQYGMFLPVGSVIAYGGANPPPDTGWLLCDGREVSRTVYADLYAAIGTTHGAGNGATTFNLPDLRGRVPMGAGHGSGLSARAVGQLLGEETHLLTVAEMPSHNHSFYRATQFSPANLQSVQTYSTINASEGGNTVATGIQANGGGQPHNNIPPSLVINYIIKY